MSQDLRVMDTVFVVGFPRSGTTWFSNLINSHPDTVYRHELFGRAFGEFGDELFSALKYKNGLSDTEYKKVLDISLKAKIDTDKPPFFIKKFSKIPSVKLQRMLWLAAKTFSPLEWVYTFLFTPDRHAKVSLVIKETRSSVNLESIVKGVRASKLLVLVRHPYGVIASHVSGAKQGDMLKTNRQTRDNWYKGNAEKNYVVANSITEKYIQEMSELELLALKWRVQNEDYLSIQKEHPNTHLQIYEEFLRDTFGNTKKLFEALGLELNQQVVDFIGDSSDPGKKQGLFSKDASSEYYSVYRGKSFNPTQWKELLSDEDLTTIDKHASGLVNQLSLKPWVDV